VRRGALNRRRAPAVLNQFEVRVARGANSPKPRVLGARTRSNILIARSVEVPFRESPRRL